jgi:tetratricopeptide (TPR) repeat protein
MSTEEGREQRDMLPAVPRLHYCYHPDDRECRDKLEKHLAALKHEGLIETRDFDETLVGDIERSEIDNHLSPSNIVILLGSCSFFSSDLHWNTMKRVLELDRAGKVKVVPICAKFYDYEITPFNKLQVLPRMKPLSKYENDDEGYAEVAKEIRQMVSKSQEREDNEGNSIDVANEQGFPLTKPRSQFDGRDEGYAEVAEENRQIVSKSQEREDNEGNSPNHFLFVEIGDILFKHQHYEEAIIAYEDAIRLDPTCKAAYYGKARALDEMKLRVYEQISQFSLQPFEKPQNDTQEDLE